jgi:hypothetical protein
MGASSGSRILPSAFAVLVSSSLSIELPVVREMRRLSAWRLEAEVRQEAASLVMRAFVSSAAS